PESARDRTLIPVTTFLYCATRQYHYIPPASSRTAIYHRPSSPRGAARQTRFLLGENQIPTHWYNVIPDMPGPLAPVIHPGTLKPVTPADMLPLFPGALLEQEMSPERWIRIPDEVRDVYRLWRPTHLHRAHRLGAASKT